MLNDMVYGGTAQNMVASRTRVRIPLWSNEGLAEFKFKLGYEGRYGLT